MSLVETSKTTTAVHKRKQRKTEAVVADAPAVPDSEFAWGAEAIGRVINRTEKQTFHLIYTRALAGAVKKVNGQYVGYVPKLRALMGGE